VYGLTLVFASMFFATACHRPEASPSAISTRFEIEPKPVRMGLATIDLSMMDQATPVGGAGVQLEANMSHPGMAPVFSDAKEIAPGQYRSRIEFTMAGDWYILVHIKLATGETLERQIDVKGVQAK
jgi:hypothetical protein